MQAVLPDGRTVEVPYARHPRARRIKLSVDDRGARLTLPPRASLAAGERFVAEHAGWLATQLHRHAPPSQAPLEPFATASLPLQGAERPLRWQPARLARLGEDPSDPDGLLFEFPERATPAAAVRVLREFYLAHARAQVGRWLPSYLSGLPRAPRSFRIRPVRSQWGSLAPDGTVSLDLALVLARPSAFEYVLVHELCHLLQANHSPRFWAEVEARFPAWREERDWLRENGGRVKARLKALLGGGAGS
nr:SprT family zinc-dependent metalloprotease [Lysobacter defluvii]